MIGKTVKHRSFGSGTIVEVAGSKLSVRFGTAVKRFDFPAAFERFLSTDDPELKLEVERALADMVEMARIRAEEEQARRAIEQEQQQRAAMLLPRKAAIVRRPNVAMPGQNGTSERYAQTELESIAFKCNFCDGGSSSSCVGFRGNCSDWMIRYNIEKAQHVWCSTGSACKRYLEGELTRSELDAYIDPDGMQSACYESRLLKCWTMSAGIYRNGDRAGEPMHIKRIRRGSLAIMTTRKPNTREQDRFIFAVYLVDQSYDGDDREEGSVVADPVRRIELKPEEAEQVLFWNYYVNANNPERIVFGSGLHRYLTDIEAAQILRDIADIRKDEFSREFYLEFCSSNGIDPSGLSAPTGALRRNGAHR